MNCNTNANFSIPNKPSFSIMIIDIVITESDKVNLYTKRPIYLLCFIYCTIRPSSVATPTLQHCNTMTQH